MKKFFGGLVCGIGLALVASYAANEILLYIDKKKSQADEVQASQGAVNMGGDGPQVEVEVGQVGF